MQRKPGNHSSAKTHAFAAAKAAKKLAYFRKDQMVKNPPAMQVDITVRCLRNFERESVVSQACLILFDAMDYSPPYSSVCGIL